MEKNLRKNKETIHLVYTYRILKFLEKASHRDKSFKDLSQFFLDKYNNNYSLLKDAFVDKVISNESSSLFNTDEFLHSHALNEQATLFRLLKDKGLLEEAIATISFKQMHSDEKVAENEEEIKTLTAFLKAYIENPEIQIEFKNFNIY